MRNVAGQRLQLPCSAYAKRQSLSRRAETYSLYPAASASPLNIFTVSSE
jgi:hypothetical protein